MSYNHGQAEKRFEETWKRLRKEYKEAGMSDEAIEEMYRFDRDVFCRDRAFFEHKHQSISLGNGYSDKDEEDEDNYEEQALAVSDESSSDHSRYWWIEEIENPMLATYIKSLSQDEIELVTLYYFEGFSQREIAKIIGISQQAVSKRIAKFEKIKNNIKKF